MTDEIEVTPSNLDDTFEGNDEAPEAKSDPKPEPKGDKEQKADEADAEPPAAEDDEEEKTSVPVAALKSERQKRQAAEAERDELKKKYASKDPQLETEIEQIEFATRTKISRELLIESNPDYQAMEDIFAEMVNAEKAANDGYSILADDMVKSRNPAKFAYDTAKESPKAAEYAEFQEFKKLKEAGKLKPVEDTPTDARKKAALAVPNINKAASVSSNSTPKESLETLDEMFE